MKIKAITISQPFAKLIANGAKFVENRSWSTEFRGPLAIHAGKGTQYLTRKELENYITGAVVSTCELIACIDINQPKQRDHDELKQNGMAMEQVLRHRHCEGPFAWVLFEVRPCSEPYFVNGKQGLWTLETTEIDKFAY